MAGMFLGSLVISRASDLVGRKRVFMFAAVTNLFLLVACLYCTNLQLMYVLCFLSGIGELTRLSVGYVYIIELFPKRAQDAAGVYFFLTTGIMFAYISLQFWFLTKKWQTNVYIALALSMMSVPCGLWVPESPHFYYAQMQFDQARAVLKQISATNNRGKPKVFKFKAEDELEMHSGKHCSESAKVKRISFNEQRSSGIRTSLQMIPS